MKKHVTMQDIARIAQVSTATVSRVLSSSSKVHPDTKRRVESVIAREGYEPNHVARSLSLRRTQTMGVVVGDFGNPFFVEIARGIEPVLHEAGYAMFLTSTGWNPDKEFSLVRTLIRNRMDGLILAPIFADSPAVDLLQAQGTPFVLLNVHSRDPNTSSVSTDNVRGGAMAAELLLTGKPSLIFALQGFPHESTFERIQGFQELLEKRQERGNFEYRLVKDIRTYEEGYRLIQQLLAAAEIHRHKTAVFATNDDVAMGVLACLNDHAVAVPSQVAVIGYDDIPMASRFQIPLTTIGQPIHEMGRLCAQELLRRLRDEKSSANHYRLLPRLVQRRSTQTGSIVIQNRSDKP